MQISTFSLFHKNKTKYLTKMFKKTFEKLNIVKLATVRCLKGTVPRDFDFSFFSLTFFT